MGFEYLMYELWIGEGVMVEFVFVEEGGYLME